MGESRTEQVRGVVHWGEGSVCESRAEQVRGADAEWMWVRAGSSR